MEQSRSLKTKEEAMAEKLFAVGDVVNVKNRNDLTEYGKIIHLHKDGRAIVHFHLPRRSPTRSSFDDCEKCGWPGFLSINGGTGELVCMRSGCGYSYGFENRDEIIQIAQLINISTQNREKERKKLTKKLKEFEGEIEILLYEAMKEKVVAKEDVREIFEKSKFFKFCKTQK